MSHLKIRVSFLLFASIYLASVLFAADPTGTITGSVTDPSGASVANARVTVTNLATSFSRTQTTQADGSFVFPLLPAGTYSVVVEAQGFRRYEQKGVEVKTDQSSSVPIPLQIGAAADSVTVEANAQMVETRSGALSQVVNAQKIVELPLDGRNAASLILL